jgi:pyruvate-formate lyase-activating enzyme
MDDVTFEDENGFINWVNMDDRSKAVNAFTSDAKRYAQEAAFVARAQEEMEKKMTEILRLHGKRAEIRYTEIERIPSY